MIKVKKSPIISLSVFNTTSAKHHLIDVKARPFYSLTFRKHGTAKINIDGKTLISPKGCITLTPKNKGYSTELLEDSHIIAIHFDCLHSDSFDTPMVIKNNSNQIERLFDEAFEKYSVEDANNFECYSIFYKILAEIEAYSQKKYESKIKPKILKAKSEIEKNFTDSNYNISTLVEKLKISPSYLRAEFKKAYSISPVEYLNSVRQRNAVSILTSDYYSIEDVAKKCGYCSTSYFIQVFKKNTGYSPLKYKEKFLEKSNL